MNPEILTKLLCCIPRGDSATRALISATLLAYGIAEGRTWAKWAGGIGLGFTGLGIARCYLSIANRRAGVDDASRPRLPTPAADGSPPNLTIVPGDRGDY